MENPLGFAFIELVLAGSMLLGAAVAAYVLVGALRGRFEWLPAAVMAVAALALPVVGPVVVLLMCRSLERRRPRVAST